MMTRSGREEKVADTRATQLTREARFYTSRGAASQARDALVEGSKSQCIHVMFVYPTDPGTSVAQALVPTNLEVAAQLASSLLACGHHDEARTAAEVVLEKVGLQTSKNFGVTFLFIAGSKMLEGSPCQSRSTI